MGWSIEVCEAKYLAANIADEIISLLNEAIEEHGFASISLSGGSTPSETYRALSRPPRVAEVNWSKVYAFLGDERWVPQTDDQSNFRMISETLISMVPNGALKCFPVDTELSSPQLGAKAYSEMLSEKLRKNSEGTPIFDLILLGIGEDGHTASLFTDSPGLKGNSPDVIAVKRPEDGSDRISISAKVIKAANNILFIAKSASKADIISKVIEGSDSAEIYPARLVTEASGKIMWFLEASAAKNLSLEN